MLLLVVGSASSAPLTKVFGLTISGDRVVGLVALVVMVGLAVGRRFRWTPIHRILAVFVGVQLVMSGANAGAWPEGLKFVSIYGLGFACFVLAAAWAAHPGDQRWAFRVWIGTGAALGLLGGLSAFFANLWQVPLWGSGVARTLPYPPGPQTVVFAATAGAVEQNLLSSFLLIPLALALWAWPKRTDGGSGLSGGEWWLGAIVWGLVFGLTRAVWISMAGLVALWWWVRRPRWQHVGVLGVLIGLALVAQTAVIGASPLSFRGFSAVRSGSDSSLAGRVAISQATIQSWLERPLLGHGAGSTNRLTVVFRERTLTKVWNPNLELFVLHDSGVLGLAALVALVAVVARDAWKRARTRNEEAWRSLGFPLAAAGVCLLFAYQFTHGLWVMYPYVHLGFLTAVIYPSDAGPDA